MSLEMKFHRSPSLCTRVIIRRQPLDFSFPSHAGLLFLLITDHSVPGMEPIAVVVLLFCSLSVSSSEILRFNGRVGRDGKFMADDSIPPLSHRMTRFINTLNTTWKVNVWQSLCSLIGVVIPFRRLTILIPIRSQWSLSKDYLECTQKLTSIDCLNTTTTSVQMK